MIDAILRGLIVGGSAYAGARMGEKYLTGATETPVWTGHVGGDVGKPAVSITQVRYRGRVYYRVYVATEGSGRWSPRAGSGRRSWVCCRPGNAT